MSSVPASAVWAGLGLSASSISAALPTPPQPSLTPADASRALAAPAPTPSFSAASRRASRSSVAAARAAQAPAARATSIAPAARSAALRIVETCDQIDAKLRGCVEEVGGLQEEVRKNSRVRETAARDAEFVEAFVQEVVVDPRLVRHIVDGRVEEERYSECLGLLRKKVAVLEMRDTKISAAYQELRGVIDKLVSTAAAKVRIFLLAKMELLRRPNTNVHIIKQNVLLRYSDLVHFLDELAPTEYVVVRDAYLYIMKALYQALFTRYAQTLMGMKVGIGADATVTALSSSSSAAAAAASGLSLSSAPLVGLEPQTAATNAFAQTTRSLSGLFGAGKGNTVTTGSNVQPTTRRLSSASAGRKKSPEPGFADGRKNSISSAVDATNAAAEAAAASSATSLFSIGNRIDVLAKIDASPIVLAVAMDNDLRFYYEELQRSLGRMVSETFASESSFVEAFLGDYEHKLFPKVFDDVIALLLDVVNAHAVASHDLVGILLALKVNEAQRTSMQHRNVLELSHYFIRVDIALKPKFKKLFDANILSLANAAAPSAIRELFKGESETKPHVISRQFADLSSSILAIASYGETDDAILDGIRRMRTEFVGFLTSMSALISQTKARYVFLINNVDVVLALYAAKNVGQSSSESRFFNELHVSYTAAYVEHEVADHFPDLVSFVRANDRRSRAEVSSSAAIVASAAVGAPSEAHVRNVLREFASNWHLGVAHMRDSVMRAFPNFQIGNDILRALFARLFSYHRRCEAAVTARYPALQSELVSGTEISFEVRHLSKPFA